MTHDPSHEQDPPLEYIDKDVPSTGAGGRAGHDGPAPARTGGYATKDVPSGAGEPEREGEYPDSDVPSDTTHSPTRSFTDKDIPG